MNQRNDSKLIKLATSPWYWRARYNELSKLAAYYETEALRAKVRASEALDKAQAGELRERLAALSTPKARPTNTDPGSAA